MIFIVITLAIVQLIINILQKNYSVYIYKIQTIQISYNQPNQPIKIKYYYYRTKIKFIFFINRNKMYICNYS